MLNNNNNNYYNWFETESLETKMKSNKFEIQCEFVWMAAQIKDSNDDLLEPKSN